MGDFYQDPPQLPNQYTADRLLRDYLQRRLPEAVCCEIEPDLRRFGERVVTDIARWGDDANAHEPTLVQFDPWGRRIDHIVTARGWQELDRISAEEGIVALGYERAQGPWSRLHQFAKLYLFAPASALYSCPLAMTDGAARLIEVLGDDDLRQRAYARLTSRDPAQFWTSGQWMTERTGGSDVGGTETVARREEQGYRLHGTKWFTSATTAQMAFTLARIEDSSGKSLPGSRGLSLFYVETRNAAGQLNDIEILRLKDKLGTRSLPTAELSLRGTPARLVGEPGRGVAHIATLVNVTRVYNTICAVAGMRRAIALARDYAHRRRAFGKTLADQPLHLETLADLETELHGAFHLGFHVAELLGRDECSQANSDETAMLRLLTPVAKLYTAKQAVAVASETLEAFGGAGYVEDTGLPRLLRDAQVLPIWEGTTNVLSLDVLRAIAKEDALAPVLDAVQRRLANLRHPALGPLVNRVESAVAHITNYLERIDLGDQDALQAGARRFAYSLARTYTASLLLESAGHDLNSSGDRRALAVATRWCRADLAPLVASDTAARADSRALALDLALTEESETDLDALPGVAERLHRV